MKRIMTAEISGPTQGAHEVAKIGQRNLAITISLEEGEGLRMKAIHSRHSGLPEILDRVIRVLKIAIRKYT
jgi:hypothetical protein